VEAEVRETNAAPVDKLLLFIKYGQIMKLSWQIAYAERRY
jgi:hypothetical protein